MTRRLRPYGSIALFSLALITHLLCGIQPASAATDDEVFSMLDSNEDGVLSGREAATVRQFDADKDGEVTKEEYFTGMASERKRLLSIDDDKLFADRDSNEDGVLSGTEIKGFENYDADSDGEVSRKEFDQGRAVDRRNVSGPNKEELARQALEKFRQLDANEDGRLSGKEMVGFEKLDSNGDKRISEKEFVAGFVSTDMEPAADPALVFLEMIRTTNPTAFLKACDPEFAKEIDRPVLKFIMERVASSLGTLEPSAKGALHSKQQTINGKPHTVYQGQLEFREGKADATVIVAQGRIVGFRLESPELNDIGNRLHNALATNEVFSKSTAEFYTPRCEEFVRLILAGDDDKAFAKYHPEVQKQIGREKAQHVFETFRKNCGTFKGFELESLRVEFDADGNGENIKLMHLVRGSKQDYLATTTFQFIGLAAHIVGLAVKPMEEQGNLTPAKPTEQKWVKVPATAEGVTFEMPAEPKRTIDADKQQVFYRVETADKSSIWTAIIETVNENFEPKAKVFFEAIQKELVTALEGELLDTDPANAGDHPGQIFFIRAKDNVFFIERAVIVGNRIYRFQAVTSEQDKRQREKVVNHYLESVKFLETDDDVPAPPTIAPPKSRPKPPQAPPALPKPPMP